MACKKNLVLSPIFAIYGVETKDLGMRIHNSD